MAQNDASGFKTVSEISISLHSYNLSRSYRTTTDSGGLPGTLNRVLRLILSSRIRTGNFLPSGGEILVIKIGLCKNNEEFVKHMRTIIL